MTFENRETRAIGKPVRDEVALAFRGVTKTFGKRNRRVQALRKVQFDALSGLITGLIGPDGAGKTTLLRLAACLLGPDEGGITVLSRDAVREPLVVQSSIGYMPQQFALYEDLKVWENLDLYANLQGVPRSERPDRYEVLMKMTNLGDFMDRLAGQLSGGMKQKLGLACTLVRSPQLLLLDEPTVGVDPVSRRELWFIIDQLVEDEHVTVILSTAYLDEAERCNRVILLHEGEVLGFGPPGEFSREQEGRIYMVTANARKRDIERRLTTDRRVVDAVIQGDGVRLVMGDTDTPRVENLLPDFEHPEITQVSPRFEDAYVAMLRGDEPEEKEFSQHIKPEIRPGREMNEEAVIRVDNVKRRFGHFHAVKGVSFDVNPSEVFGLLGANGAGKTTTFRMLCGLLPVSEGNLSVAGVDLRKAAARARSRIGYMSQKFSLYENLNVLQNLRFFSSAYGLKGKHRSARMEWALAQFGLRSLGETTSGRLPLGYKQRLALACVLMHEPDILFLDEPTSGVDPIARRAFWRQISALADSGVTVLVTTHFMKEAEYCDRLAIMAAGEILAIGSPSEIRAQTPGRPAETMEEAFIALIRQQNGE